MFKAIGNPEPRFVYAPTWIFDYIINALQFLATLTKSQALEDAAETAGELAMAKEAMAKVHTL